MSYYDWIVKDSIIFSALIADDGSLSNIQRASDVRFNVVGKHVEMKLKPQPDIPLECLYLKASKLQMTMQIIGGTDYYQYLVTGIVVKFKGANLPKPIRLGFKVPEPFIITKSVGNTYTLKWYWPVMCVIVYFVGIAVLLALRQTVLLQTFFIVGFILLVFVMFGFLIFGEVDPRAE